MNRAGVWGGRLWTVIAVVSTAAGWIVTKNVGLALAPMLVIASFWTVSRVEIRYPVAVLLFFALLVENPQARPMEDRWSSPLFAIGNLFYTNLNTLTGVEILRFSLFEFLLVGLVGLLAIRRMTKIGADGIAPLHPGSKWLIRLLGIALLTALFLWGWGLIRGGDLRQSLWQVRQLLWLPPLAWLCIHAFRRKNDGWLIAGIFLIVGSIRALFGFAYYAMSRLEGHVPSYVTTHADSILLMIGVIICLAAVAERPGPRTWAIAASFLFIAGPALLINNRRLAFVVLGAAAIALLFVIRKEVSARIRRLLVLSSPLLVIYGAVGWHIEHRVFKPVRVVRSILDEADTSNHTREVENFNLIFTALSRPLIGSGLGHPYDEHIYTYRIDHIFEQYSFMPHNSVLWLFAIGGILGFIGLWGYLPWVIWLSARCYRESGGLSTRVAALGGVAVVVAYVISAWGDMGVHSWMVTLILAAYVGLVGNFERHTRVRRGNEEGSFSPGTMGVGAAISTATAEGGAC